MNTAVARVYVNGVEVGALPSKQYRTLVEDVKRDRWLYVAQAFNLLWTTYRFSLSAVMLVWQLWAVAFIGLALFVPQEIGGLVAGLRAATPEQAAHALQILAAESIGFAVFTLLVGTVTGGLRHGYVNEFASEVNRRVRRLLEVPAEGNVVVTVARGDEQ